MKKLIIIFLCCILNSCIKEPKKTIEKKKMSKIADTSLIGNKSYNQENLKSKNVEIVKKDTLNSVKKLSSKNNLDFNFTIETLEKLLQMQEEYFEKYLNANGYFFEEINNNKFFKVFIYYNNKNNTYLSYNIDIKKEKTYSVTLQTQNKRDLNVIFSELNQKGYTEKREEIFNNIKYEHYKLKDIREIYHYKSNGIYSLTIENLN